jgi:hypothetical protein
VWKKKRLIRFGPGELDPDIPADERTFVHLDGQKIVLKIWHSLNIRVPV